MTCRIHLFVLLLPPAPQLSRWDGAPQRCTAIHWFRPPHFSDFKPGSDSLEKFQTSLQHTRLLVLDEVSVIGRQMMGRIHCRLRQSSSGRDEPVTSLGGFSCVAVGDPAQCEAIFDQQSYDPQIRVPTGYDGSLSNAAKLSNLGLDVCASFTTVVILKTPHRIRQLCSDQLSHEDTAYNDRAQRFVEVQHRLRDLAWTPDDYYWLCKRKRSAVSLGERLRFKDAPVLMEFRRTTAGNPEQNCDFFNRMKLRTLASETGVSVARFVSIHTGVDQNSGLRLDAMLFRGLPPDLELAEGALVILISNLAVEHGLMNGTRGVVRKIIYANGKSPLAPDLRDRMPDVVVVDCPQYVGPAFFSDVELRTWIPLLPRTVPADNDPAITRTQFPLTLGWALTSWKAQGMTLQKVIVSLGAVQGSNSRCSVCGSYSRSSSG